MSRFSICLGLAIVLCLNVFSGEAEKPSTVCRIKVVSDKVPDLSSPEAWKKHFIKDGMSDQDKAIAIWKTVAAFQYQDTGPVEYLTHEDGVYEPFKMFNVYGYGICCYASAHVVSLGRYIGMGGRGWGINCHSVCELQYGGAWHLIDSSLITYFPKADGVAASVEEITAGVTEWYKKNPEYWDGKHGIDAKLRKFEREDGRTAWKTRGPEVLKRSPAYNEKGWFPAGTHGWYATMQEYDGTGGGSDGKQFIYEYGALHGYELNIQLRPGERLTRNWSHKNLHVNMDAHKDPPDSAFDKHGFLGLAQAWMAKHDPSLAVYPKIRIGNGTHEYDVPLANLGGAALTAENLVSKNADPGPALHVKNADAPGVLVIRMPSSYVYLTGTVNVKTAIADGGSIGVEFSDTNGLSWKPLATLAKSGDETIDLSKLVLRRYDYRLKFTLKGKGTGLDALKISHDVQQSQRALPALGLGENKIAFSAGPQESTITIAAKNSLNAHKDKQVEYTDFKPEVKGLNNALKMEGPEGSITFPVSVPGEMTRLRTALHYRTWGDEDCWEVHASFDSGKTFNKIGDGPPQKFGRTAYVVYDKVPAGTKDALVKFVGKKKSENLLFAFRIDADYKAPQLGFRPVKVTYVWDENGAEKRHEYIARKADEAYTIKCDAAPTMKSIVLEVAE
ncbi:MAG TPA: hypothetical protein VEJ63_15155 [Planctomycetota bacterium]|nr:hypothetical protein [Planctomycetota bacterium]